MKKIISFIICMALFPISYAQMAAPNQIASNQVAPTACDQVSGLWLGSWEAFGCNWVTSGVGVKDGDNIYFNFKAYDSNCGAGQSFTMRGTCTNGQVSLANGNATMPGSIYAGKITISGNGQKGILNKI